MKTKEDKIYWKGFEEGKENTIKHLIRFLKLVKTKRQRSKRK